MIRPACDSDLPPILRMAQAMWAEAPAYRCLPLDLDRTAAVLEHLVADGTLLVWSGEGGPQAFLLFSVYDDPWTGLPCASELALYVAPEQRGAGLAGELVAAAQGEAMRRGCLWFTSGTSTGCEQDAAAVVYQRAGFKPAGQAYRKSLAPLPVPA